MSNMLDEGTFLNYVLSSLLKKIIVPSDYHNQVKALKELQSDDISGLVDSLTDLAVNTSNVDFSIETTNDNFTSILKRWLGKINLDINQIPTGIQPLAKEYLKERWKYSSFPILKIGKWTEIKGVLLPSQIFIIDGGSVRAKDKNENDDNLHIVNYDYYIGNLQSKNKLGKNSIITKPYGRWHDKYPTPFLIKRGIYHNWKIIQSIKNKESEILDQIIPYLLLIKKGTEGLATNNIKSYSDEELKDIINQFQSLMDNLKGSDLPTKINKSAVRAANFDEEIKHLIPDLSAIFEPKLFSVAERNILSGLGFIDVIEATSSSRRESILNPKAFIEECKSAVKDFKQILKELVLMIIEKNESHIKYINEDFYIASSPITGFLTDDFKKQIQRLWRSGRISDQTAIETVAEVDFETEVMRKEKENKKELQKVFYPPITENREDENINAPSKENVDEDIPEDKTDPVEKKEYDIGEEIELIGAPYEKIEELPSRIKDNMSKSLQKIYIETFNKVYNKYKDETKAQKIAWNVITKIGRKNKENIWVKKSTSSKLTSSLINKEINGN